MSISSVSPHQLSFLNSYMKEKVSMRLFEVNKDTHTFIDEDLFLLNTDRCGAIKVKKGEDPVATVGVGPCIVIIAYGTSSSGKRVNGLYHWSGPCPDQSPNDSAVKAIEHLISNMQVHKVSRDCMEFICLGGEEMSKKNQDALNELKSNYKIISDVINFPYESEIGWDIVVDKNSIYYGVGIVKESFIPKSIQNLEI